jgi:hypothetical protein
MGQLIRLTAESSGTMICSGCLVDCEFQEITLYDAVRHVGSRYFIRKTAGDLGLDWRHGNVVLKCGFDGSILIDIGPQ